MNAPQHELQAHSTSSLSDLDTRQTLHVLCTMHPLPTLPRRDRGITLAANLALPSPGE